MSKRRQRGYSSWAAKVGNRRSPSSPDFYTREIQREHNCPLCMWNGEKEEDFKVHWKEKHSSLAHRLIAKSNAFTAHRLYYKGHKKSLKQKLMTGAK